MPSYLQENVVNSVFRGTCINGVITISGYFDANAETITMNSLRGSVVISKGAVIGYIANNTPWVNGGFTAYLAYNVKTEYGLTDVQFVFPAGRLSMNSVPISSKSQGAIDSENTLCLDVLAMSAVAGGLPDPDTIYPDPFPGDGIVHDPTVACGIMVRTNRGNLYDNELLPGDTYIDPLTGLVITQQPPTLLTRTGVRVLY